MEQRKLDERFDFIEDQVIGGECALSVLKLIEAIDANLSDTEVEFKLYDTPRNYQEAREVTGYMLLDSPNNGMIVAREREDEDELAEFDLYYVKRNQVGAREGFQLFTISERRFGSGCSRLFYIPAIEDGLFEWATLVTSEDEAKPFNEFGSDVSAGDVVVTNSEFVDMLAVNIGQNQLSEDLHQQLELETNTGTYLPEIQTPEKEPQFVYKPHRALNVAIKNLTEIHGETAKSVSLEDDRKLYFRSSTSAEQVITCSYSVKRGRQNYEQDFAYLTYTEEGFIAFNADGQNLDQDETSELVDRMFEAFDVRRVIYVPELIDDLNRLMSKHSAGEVDAATLEQGIASTINMYFVRENLKGLRDFYQGFGDKAYELHLNLIPSFMLEILNASDEDFDRLLSTGYFTHTEPRFAFTQSKRIPNQSDYENIGNEVRTIAELEDLYNVPKKTATQMAARARNIFHQVLEEETFETWIYNDPEVLKYLAESDLWTTYLDLGELDITECWMRNFLKDVAGVSASVKAKPRQRVLADSTALKADRKSVV